MVASKTFSTCTLEVAQGTHVFHIRGFSKHRGMGNGDGTYIRSGIFTVGGHDWAIRFYPDGCGKESHDFISVFLELVSNSTEVWASCDLRLVDQCTGSSSSVHKTRPRIFNHNDYTAYAPDTPHFKRRSEIKNSAYLRDDRLTIECIVTVIKKPRVTETKSFPKIYLPPSDMAPPLPVAANLPPPACRSSPGHQMAASKTFSTCTPEVAQGTHVFDIRGYSKHRGMGNGDGTCIRSGIFTVGGHDWAIRFYPDGYGKESHDFISVYLELVSNSTEVWASCDLRLVDQCTGSSSSVHKTGPRIFSYSDYSAFAPDTPRFKRRSEIKNSAYLRDDLLTIKCIVTVIKKPRVTETKSFPKIDLPPSDMAEHLGRLLEEKEGFDVSFNVGGESIEAHRFVLSMRSPVFKAELYGPMREARTGQCITIKDIQPAVFRALLHFIYTDSLPSKDLDTEMIRLLLVAADIYAMERLKLVCQSILCEGLNTDTVAMTLALADQHNCSKLKDACLEFIEMSDAMDAVMETQGFKELMGTCPSLVLDALVKRIKLHKA